MQRKASKLVLISAGAALAWFLDPVSGEDRRRQVVDRFSGMTGGSTGGGDPTGGATPPAVAGVPPLPTNGFPSSGPARPPQPAGLAQAVEAAGGGEKVLLGPDGATDPDPASASW